MHKIRFVFKNNDCLNDKYRQVIEQLIDIWGKDVLIETKDNDDLWIEHNDNETYTVDIFIDQYQLKKLNEADNLKSFQIIQ